MRIIIDECLPVRLRKYIEGYDVETVMHAGFTGLQNGKLLSAIDKEYDVFITIDSNLEYQQNLSDKSLKIIVLRASSNRLEDILPLLPIVYEAIQTMNTGEIKRIP